MSFCSKCGQPEYHPSGTCPYDNEVPFYFSSGILFPEIALDAYENSQHEATHTLENNDDTTVSH